MFINRSLLFTIAILTAPALAKAVPIDQNGVEECRAWFADRHSARADGEIKVAPENTICFDGEISKRSIEKLIAAINAIDPGEPITLVARSIGGDAFAGLKAGVLLAQRHSTIIAEMTCVSSCANYFFLMSKHRVIAPDTVLAFHGGIVPEFAERVTHARASGLHVDPSDPRVQEVRTEYERAYEQQSKILAALHIKHGFFEWFEHIPLKEFEKNCPGFDTKTPTFMLVFSPEALRARGIDVEENKGPTSASQLDKAVARFSDVKNYFCYWPD